MLTLWLWASGAEAGELRPVLDGDSVESIAASLGDEALAGTIRGLNQLAPGEQPEVGRLLLLPPPASAQQVDQRASLVSMVGDVQVTPPGGLAQPGVLFELLGAGSTVCTAEGSYATLQLASSCEGKGELVDEVTLHQETCVEIRSIVASSLGRSSVVRVLAGSVVIADPRAADPGAPPSSVTVEAGTGVVSGAGGFRAHLEEDRALRTEALYQPLSVMGAGQQRALEAGQGARVPEGGVPSEPVDLLGAGPLLSPEAGEPLRRPAFAWRGDPEAFGYQFSIAGDARFTRVLYVEPTPEPGHLAELLFLPMTNIEGLWWRVATLDRFGYLGVPSGARALTVPAGVRP